MSDFTDEDVTTFLEAASDLWEEGHFTLGTRAGLAAVLPEYAKRVRAEALRDAAAEVDARHWWRNDGKSFSRWLRARADALTKAPSDETQMCSCGQPWDNNTAHRTDGRPCWVPETGVELSALADAEENS
jgi:hypothetical protein